VTGRSAVAGFLDVAEKLRADIELVEDAIELAEGGAGTN
jgi:hypothetical protein